MRKISNILFAFAIILSNVMSAVVAYNYCELEWGMRYAGYSAGPEVAFFYIVPYGIAIAGCVAIAMILRKKGK